MAQPSSEPYGLGERLPDLVDRILASYTTAEQTHHIDKQYLPSRNAIVEALEMLLEVMYPGYFGRRNLTSHNVVYHVGELLPRIGEILHREIYHSFCFLDEIEGKAPVGGDDCRERAREMVVRFLEMLPEIRALLADDVQAAFDGDPAAVHPAEAILCYPGVLAISVHRLAHVLHLLGVPWVPRVMSEWSHGQTGIDIHPGAIIGRRCFIDHGTGVVIGETAELGDNVKVYQGVTLGALSFPKDERGRLIRGHKRHPTVANNVTLYANAIVLGGDTTVGDSAVVGGSVFLTSTIPSGCTVTIKPPELTIRKGRGKDAKSETKDMKPAVLDYQI
jgi:serine O-acetyltransferase